MVNSFDHEGYEKNLALQAEVARLQDVLERTPKEFSISFANIKPQDMVLDRMTHAFVDATEAGQRLQEELAALQTEAARLRAFVKSVANHESGNDKDCVFAYLDFQKEARKLLAELGGGSNGS